MKLFELTTPNGQVIVGVNLIKIEEDNIGQHQVVYTPDEVFGSAGKKHNIFQYDKRIEYSTDFGNIPEFYKISKSFLGKNAIGTLANITEEQAKEWGVEPHVDGVPYLIALQNEIAIRSGLRHSELHNILLILVNRK